MASGCAKDGAVKEQIDASVDDAVKLTLDQLTGLNAINRRGSKDSQLR